MRPGLLKGEAVRQITAGDAISINSRDDRWQVLVDERSGWIRIGQGKPDEDREGVEFAPGAGAVLQSERLVALWLHPEWLPVLRR
jgi:hypothetical protein